MLETLQKYRQDIATAAHKCENLGHTDPSQSSADSSVMALAIDVTQRLMSTIERLDKYLGRLRENLVQWESVDKVKLELANWLMAKTGEVGQLEERPAKLHQEAAALELAHLEVGLWALVAVGSGGWWALPTLMLLANLSILMNSKRELCYLCLTQTGDAERDRRQGCVPGQVVSALHSPVAQ